MEEGGEEREFGKWDDIMMDVWEQERSLCCDQDGASMLPCMAPAD